MSLLSFICIWHAIVHVVEKRGAESAAILADKVALGVMAVAYLIVQLVFAIRLSKQVCLYTLVTIRIINTLMPGQNGRHFADDVFKFIFLIAEYPNFSTRTPINPMVSFGHFPNAGGGFIGDDSSTLIYIYESHIQIHVQYIPLIVHFGLLCFESCGYKIGIQSIQLYSVMLHWYWDNCIHYPLAVTSSWTAKIIKYLGTSFSQTYSIFPSCSEYTMLHGNVFRITGPLCGKFIVGSPHKSINAGQCYH